MHPFLYRFMPSPAASTPRNLGGKNTQIFQKVSRKGGRHPSQSLKTAMKLLIFLRF